MDINDGVKKLILERFSQAIENVNFETGQIR